MMRDLTSASFARNGISEDLRKNLIGWGEDGKDYSRNGRGWHVMRSL